MDLNTQFLRNEVKHLEVNLGSLKDSLILINSFLKEQFGNKFTKFCESKTQKEGEETRRRGRRNRGRGAELNKKGPLLDLDDDGDGEKEDPVMFDILDAGGEYTSPLSASSSGEDLGEGEEEGEDYDDDPTYIQPQIPTNPNVTVKTEPLPMDDDEENCDETDPSSQRGGGGGSPKKKRRARKKFTKIASFSTFEEATNFVKNEKDGGGVWWFWSRAKSKYPGDRYYYECKFRRRVKYEKARRKKKGIQNMEDLISCEKTVYIMKPKTPGRNVEVYEQNPDEPHPCLTDCPERFSKSGIDRELKRMVEDVYNGGLKKAAHIIMELKQKGVEMKEGDEKRIRGTVQYMRRMLGDAVPRSKEPHLEANVVTSPPPKKKRIKPYTPTGKPRGRPSKYSASTVSSTTVEQNSVLHPDQAGWGNLMETSTADSNRNPAVLGQDGNSLMNMGGTGHPFLLTPL